MQPVASCSWELVLVTSGSVLLDRIFAVSAVSPSVTRDASRLTTTISPLTDRAHKGCYAVPF
jgi:hypothetical protein